MDVTPTSEPHRIHCLRPLSDPPVVGSGQHGGTAAAITDAVVALVRGRAGRGPTKARTALSANLAIVTLADYLVPAEATLVREGQGEVALAFRSALIEGMRVDAVAAVEALLGRKVVAYLTAHELDPELSTIAFHFGHPAEPHGD